MKRPALSAQPEPPRGTRERTLIRGVVTYWNDERGYGFIDAGQGRANVFFHISAFAYRKRRPHKGETVSFLPKSPGSRQRPAAERVVVQGHEKALFQCCPYDPAREKPFFVEGGVYVLIDIVFFATLTFLSPPIALACAVLSVLSVALYSYDKYAAIGGRQRVPEASFYLASFLGGWPGALIARPFLRHKVTKNRFIFFFWMTIALNLFSLHLLLRHIHGDT